MTDRHVDDILTSFRDLPLPLRMREAAKVLREADQRRYPDYHQGNEYGWYSRELEGVADRFEREDKEAEDRAKAEQDAMVEELAKWLSINIGNWPLDEWHLRLKPDYWHDRARELMGAGWRKGSSDE